MQRNRDPQFTTRGAGEQLDPTVAAAGQPIAGPNEGQGGAPKRVSPPRPRPRRKSVAARRGGDETGRRTGTAQKAKNAGQLRNPRERKNRQLGPTGRARARVGRKRRGKNRTAAGRRRVGAGGSPKAKRRKANRGTA
jgi:hypothetical protein